MASSRVSLKKAKSSKQKRLYLQKQPKTKRLTHLQIHLPKLKAFSELEAEVAALNKKISAMTKKASKPVKKVKITTEKTVKKAA